MTQDCDVTQAALTELFDMSVNTVMICSYGSGSEKTKKNIDERDGQTAMTTVQMDLISHNYIIIIIVNVLGEHTDENLCYQVTL